jgi:hypothetical protein
MVDRCIGEGELLSAWRFPGRPAHEYLAIQASGTILAESDVIQLLVKFVRQQYPGAKPEAVRLVTLNGTWLEAPQWSSDWHPINLE